MGANHVPVAAMPTCLVLDRPGPWRLLILISGLSLVALPAIPPLLAALQDSNGSVGSVFVTTLLRSATVASLAAALGFLIGLPAGLILALHQFPLRRALTLALAIVLVLPTFLMAIGLSMLTASTPWRAALSGLPGTVFSVAPVSVSLVTFLTLGAARALSRSQIDAARLAGGERAVLGQAARAVWPLSGLAALLAGTLALSEAGPGLIFGHHGVASEILISFAAHYDFAQAARQCLLLGAVVLLVAAPAAALLAPRVASGLLARDTEPAHPARTPWFRLEGIGAAVLIIVSLVLPTIGLLAPLRGDFAVHRAVSAARSTLDDTLFYAIGAAAIATALGFALALAARGMLRGRVVLIALLLLVFVLPSSFTALGWISLAAAAPAFLDPILRGRVLLAMQLALHVLPIATLFALRALNAAPASWFEAGALHGIGVTRFIARVLLPWSAPVLLIAAVLIALLASADIASVLLLHPPGQPSFALLIIATMANAPESYVATLCLLYMLGSTLTALTCLWLIHKWH
jgi:iron(III) transport system permease protein